MTLSDSLNHYTNFNLVNGVKGADCRIVLLKIFDSIFMSVTVEREA